MIKKPFFKGRDYILFYRATELFFYVDLEFDSDITDTSIRFPTLKSITLCIEVLGKVRGNQPILQDYIRIGVDDKYLWLSDRIEEYYIQRFPIADIEIVKA